MIGADFPKLHIHKDVRYISDEDPCAVKTELGWVLLGRTKPSVLVQSNRISTDVKKLDLQTFWSIDSYGTVKKPDRILMTLWEKVSVSRAGIMKSVCYGRIPMCI